MSASQPTRIDIPLGRLAWMLTATMLPASLAGLVFWPMGSLFVFIACLILSLSMTALAFGDHQVQMGRAQSNGSCLALVFLGLPAMAVVEGVGYHYGAWSGLAAASAGYVTAGTLLLAWLNLEGVSLVLLLVNACNAAGVALSLSHDRKLALMFGLGSLVLGVLVSMVRGFFRARTDARR